MFKATKVHSGQYKRYGDSFYEWEIKTDLSKEKVLEECFTKLAKAEYPSRVTWEKNIVGENKNDAGYYFHGYYMLSHTFNDGGIDGYYFTICHPYTD